MLVPEQASNVSILQPGRYTDDELRLRGCAPVILLPAGMMDPTMTKEEKQKIELKEQIKLAENKTDIDILRDELKRMLDSM